MTRRRKQRVEEPSAMDVDAVPDSQAEASQVEQKEEDAIPVAAASSATAASEPHQKHNAASLSVQVEPGTSAGTAIEVGEESEEKHNNDEHAPAAASCIRCADRGADPSAARSATKSPHPG